MKNPNILRFEKKMQPVESGCILWTGSKDKNGYGWFKINNKTIKAHRAAYLLFVGEIGDKWVLHTCDNPSCVNTDHLFLGTALDNNQDMIRKGRARPTGRVVRGMKNPNRKLTQDDVNLIRCIYTGEWGQCVKLAKQYSVSPVTISKIVRGQLW